MFTKPIFFSVIVLSLLSVFGLNLVGTSGHSYYSISPAEFIPQDNACFFQNQGNVMVTNGCFDSVAGLHLPDGVTITKITLYWTDNSVPANIILTLYRNNLNYSKDDLAEVYSTGSTGADFSTFILTSIPIDNSQYTYYFDVLLMSNQLLIYGIIVEYDYPSFLSLIKK